jgi:hypothetical protein
LCGQREGRVRSGLLVVATGLAAAAMGASSTQAGAQGPAESNAAGMRPGEKIVSNGRGLWVVRRSGRRRLPRNWSIEGMSPNGLHSHFRTSAGGNTFLRVVDRRGRVRTLATWPRRCGMGTPDWSPDSTQIVYSRDPLPCPMEGSSLAELVVVSVTGGASHTLVMPSPPTELFQFGVPFWGPSGIAMGASIIEAGDYEGRTGVWLFSPDGATGPRLVVDSFMFTTSRTPGQGSAHVYPHEWSPDGRTILVDVGIPRTTRSAMYTYDVGSGDVKLAFRAPGILPDDISWSRDSRRLVYTHSISADRSIIRVVNREGTGLRALTRPPRGYADVTPVWSPDGRRVAFHRLAYPPLGLNADQFGRWHRSHRPRWLVAPVAGGRPRPLKLPGMKRGDQLLAWR